MTQKEIILKHLQEHKEGITSLYAFQYYGITRLSAIICNLRKEYPNITGKLEPVKNMYGSKCYVSRYVWNNDD